MTILAYPLFLFGLTIISLCLWKCIISGRKTSIPINWPLVGMLPAVFQNSHRIPDFVFQVLKESGGTFQFRGPWFCNSDMLLTCDPNNIQHILCKKFSNYPKGPEFRKIFDILGDGIINVDFELWELHRRTTLSLFTDAKFYAMLERAIWQKVKTGLLPVLDHVSEQGIAVDMQAVFQRFAFDNICQLVLDYDPLSLSINLPYVPSEKAFNDTIEALLYRHVLPESIWRLQSWFKIGREGKLLAAWKAFDEFVYPIVELNEGNFNCEKKDNDFNLLKVFKQVYEEKNGHSRSAYETKKFLRDTAVTLLFGGRDTTSTCLTWLFWLISKNPLSESKIREEIVRVLDLKEGEKWRPFSIEESRKLIYLHGALCESLRLFSPIALEHKAPLQADVLPSGNSLGPNSKVIISFYSTGRMENLWGNDCLEFKPERWITPAGGIRHEPSYKFPVFNAGPRTCLGKEMAFIQMKMVAASIIYRYSIQLVEGHPVSPRDSIVLQAKHGLRMALSRRNV